VQHLGAHNLVSVQQQGSAEADLLGVQNFHFEDLADCAALMSTLDEIVTIDTAALHLAGAIGHRRVTALLSHWHSWRWITPWYRNVQFIRQQAANDWATAFAQIP
jgi:ADP-heptose:LPS heptosyltransferase